MAALPPEDTGPEYNLPPEALAQILGITPRTLKRWRAEGKGPAYIRISRQRVVYDRAAARQWIRERTFRHRAEELSRQTSDAA